MAELVAFSEDPSLRVGPWLASGLDSDTSQFNVTDAPEEGTPVVGYRVMYFTQHGDETIYRSPLVKHDGLSLTQLEHLTPDVEYDNELRSSIPIHNPRNSDFGYYYFPDKTQAEEYMKMIALGKVNVALEPTPMQRYSSDYEMTPSGDAIRRIPTYWDERDDELRHKAQTSGLGLFRVTGNADKFIPEMDTAELRREGVRMKDMQIDPEPELFISYETLGQAGVAAQEEVTPTYKKLKPWA